MLSPVPGGATDSMRVIYDPLSAVFSTWGEEQGASNALIAAYFFLVG